MITKTVVKLGGSHRCSYLTIPFGSISWQLLFTQSPEVIPTHHYLKKMFIGLHLAAMDVRVRLWFLSSSREQRGKCGMMNANSSGGKENAWMPIITVSRSGLAALSNCLEKGLRGLVPGHGKEAAGMVTIRARYGKKKSQYGSHCSQSISVVCSI